MVGRDDNQQIRIKQTPIETETLGDENILILFLGCEKLSLL